MTSTRPWSININLWKEKPIKDKCLLFTWLALGKLKMTQLFCLAGSSFTATQKGKVLRIPARARAAAGDICVEKGFLAESSACRRPLLGWWIIFSMARAGSVGTGMWLVMVSPLQGSCALFGCYFPSLIFALVKQKPNWASHVWLPGKCDWRSWAPVRCSARAQNPTFPPQIEPLITCRCTPLRENIFGFPALFLVL